MVLLTKKLSLIQGLPLQTMAELGRYEISLRDEEVRRQLVIWEFIFHNCLMFTNLFISPLPPGWHDILNWW
jgi:hypothetical protein